LCSIRLDVNDDRDLPNGHDGLLSVGTALFSAQVRREITTRP
jgi:hypothetical protein